LRLVQISLAAAFTAEFDTYVKSFGVGVPVGVWQKIFLFPRGTDVSKVRELSDVPSFGGKLF
jgi:hypothetical protein